MFLPSHTGAINLKSLHPKATSRKASLNVNVNITELFVNLAARHVPMLQTIIKCVHSTQARPQKVVVGLHWTSALLPMNYCRLVSLLYRDLCMVNMSISCRNLLQSCSKLYGCSTSFREQHEESLSCSPSICRRKKIPLLQAALIRRLCSPCQTASPKLALPQAV